MPEPLYMLMVRMDELPSWYVSAWEAVVVPGRGRVLTREEAEDLAAREDHGPRFLLPFTPGTRVHGAPEGQPARWLEILSEETIWDYGEPLRVDMTRLLRRLTDRAPASSPTVTVAVADVVSAAADAFGRGEPHDVEAHFDRLVLHLGGRRQGEPPAYRLARSALGES